MALFEYFQNIDLSDIHDSMELESNRLVASIKTRTDMIDICVNGDVRVLYKGVIYKTQCQFPEELMQMFHNGTAYTNPDVEVINNNWFEVIHYRKKGRKWDWSGDCDVLDDIEGMTPDKILKTLLCYLND